MERHFINLNGIKYYINGDPTSETVKVLMHQARIDLKNLHDIQPMGDIKRLERPWPGGLYEVKSLFGVDEAHIAVPDQQPTTIDVWQVEPEYPQFDVIYRPAFFAYDGSKNFMGFVVCMENRWGAPYQFVAWNGIGTPPGNLFLGQKNSAVFRAFTSGTDTYVQVEGSSYQIDSYPDILAGSFETSSRAFIFQPQADGPTYYLGFVEISHWAGDDIESTDFRYMMFVPDKGIAQYNDPEVIFTLPGSSPTDHPLEGGYRAFPYEAFYIGDLFTGGVAMVSITVTQDCASPIQMIGG